MANKYLHRKSWWLGLVLSLLLPISAYAQTTLTKIQVMGFPAYTRVIFSLSDPSQYRIFTLSHPNRIVIDLNNARFKASLKDLSFTDTNLIQIRCGRPPNTTALRVVFDLNVLTHYKSFFAAGNNPHEAQLVIDIDAKMEPRATTLLTQRRIAPSKALPGHAPYDVVHGRQLKKIAKLPTKAQSALPPAKKSVLRQVVSTPRPFTIVVDPGHGGKDPGTIGAKGTKEKTVVLALALRLAELINKEPNMRAVLTRRGDHFVPLRNRIRLARKDKADLFIAIHADSYLNDHSEGASVYALSRHGATTEAARWLAKRENYSELGGVDFSGLGDKSYLLRSVLIDLAQTATITDSLRLGANVLDALQKVVKLHYSRVEQAPFVVLKSPDIPSILVETGFLSNPSEEERLRTKEYRDTLARALLEGIRSYVAAHPMIASNANYETIRL